jgi:PEP-CTERM motif
MRLRSLAALTAAALAAGVVHADVIENIQLAYSTGATLDGTVVCTDDFSSVISLNATLNGYDPYLFGFQGTGFTDLFSAAFPTNSPPGPGTFFALINDGTYNNFIDFGYTFDSSGITLTPVYNDVNYLDSFASGSVTSVSEPGTLALLAVGLFGLAATRRRWALSASPG